MELSGADLYNVAQTIMGDYASSRRGSERR